jgi:two-component system response regulator DegU
MKALRSKKDTAGVIRILIVDDNDDFRTHLKRFLSLQENVVVVGEAGNGMRAIYEAQTLKPDLILMDIAMPDVNGPDAARTIGTVSPESRIVFLTIHDEETYHDLSRALRIDGLIAKQLLNIELPRYLQKFRKFPGFM